jgi:hypothetical protein
MTRIFASPTGRAALSSVAKVGLIAVAAAVVGTEAAMAGADATFNRPCRRSPAFSKVRAARSSLC